MAQTLARALSAAAALSLLAPGCARPERAPEGLDELVLFAFRHFDSDDPTSAASLADALVGFESWWDESHDDPNTPYSAELVRLGPDELSILDPAPSRAQGEAALGVLYARHTVCTLDEVDRVYLENDQLALFPDSYEVYERHDTTGFDCYASGECEEAAWQADVQKVEQVVFVEVTYNFTIAAGARRFQARPPDASLDAEELEGRLARTWLMEEARLEPETVGRFLQNYQLEFVLPRDQGVLHFYALWTEVQSTELNTEASIFLNSYIQGIEDYLDDFEAHCADWD
ncbi:MAG TPA: hypothetical protein DIU15_19125 [Deltaproteobacteria bacterium]|nr:hypothetical protein [Deltaproteobacteria bacterium]HCP48159.1 hypothetical protein [Deltaproteobacteria bacterium]